MNKELKDCTTEELEARFDELFSMTAMQLAALEWDGDSLLPWNSAMAIDEELGRRA